MKTIFFIFLLFSTVFNILLASTTSNRELSHFKVKTASKKDIQQNKLKKTEISHHNHRRNIFWPYQNKKNQSNDFGVQANLLSGNFQNILFEGRSLSIILGRKFSNTMNFDFSPGVHQFELSNHSGTIRNDRIFIFSSNMNFLLKNSQVRIKYKSDYEYQNYRFIDNLSSSLTSKTFLTNYTYTPTRSINLSVEQRLVSYSDNNLKSLSQFEVNKKVVLNFMELSFGLGVSKESNKMSNVSYYSPDNIFSYGPKQSIELQFSDLFLLTNETSYSFTETDNVESRDLWNEARLQLFKRNDHNLSIAHSISSSKSTERWYENSFEFSLNFFM